MAPHLNQYNLVVKTPYSLLAASDFIDAVELHCELLPEYLPNKWGWLEPNKIFERNNIQCLIPPNSKIETVYWKRNGLNKCSGSWEKRFKGLDNPDIYHATITLEVNKSIFQDKLSKYLITVSKRFNSDIAVIDGCADQYKKIGIANQYMPSASLIFLNTLRHWLPDMPWLVVFGPAYVRMFGKEKLLTTPAYKVEEIGEEFVFVQLTSNMKDIYEQYEAVMQARDIAKKHLGEEHFFSSKLAYDYRTQPEKAGKVFKVPFFNMRPD